MFINRACVFAVLLAVSANGFASPIQWTAAAGGNDHWYEIVGVSNGITWTDAKAAAESVGGYLTTLTSAEENSFVFTTLANNATYWQLENPASGSLLGPWLGGFQPDPNSAPNAGWEWVTGEAWSYTNWLPGEPNDSLGPQSNLIFFNYNAITDTWDDFADTGSYIVNGVLPIAYIIEFDSLPNGSNVPLPPSLVLIASGWIALRIFRSCG